MTESNAEADALIEGYKQVLVAEAELARGDLDEIEDHLRSLTEELRGTGMPRVAAVREACRRLGDPRAVAREHARIRSPFGARLSKSRAYSAVALMLVLLISGAVTIIPFAGMLSLFGLQLVFGGILAIAVALRLSWARPILVGGIACFAVQVGLALAVVEDPQPIWLAMYLGILAFVVPWRRAEITASGVALALQVWAFGAAVFAVQFQISTPTGFHSMSTGAEIAFFTTTLATLGGILRARWGVVASLASTFAMAFALYELAPLAFHGGFVVGIAIRALVLSGVVAALVSTFIGGRTARSTLGTLEHVLA